MKKIFFLLLAFILSACSTNDDDSGNELLFAYAPINSVELPESMVLGETYVFKINYTNPSPCHQLFGYEYVQGADANIFAIVTSYNPDNYLCTEEEGATGVYEWEFTVELNENHIFKFWQGVDQNEKPVFITREVEVRETI